MGRGACSLRLDVNPGSHGKSFVFCASVPFLVDPNSTFDWIFLFSSSPDCLTHNPDLELCFCLFT